MDAPQFLNIPNIIQAQFEEIAPGRVLVSDEQAFLKLTPEMAQNKIVAVVRLGSATTNYGQTALPVSIVFMGFKDEIRFTKQIVTEYALAYNLKAPTETANYLQFYNTPSVVQNFNQAADGFDSILSMSGYFLFGGTTNYITSITYAYQEDEEDKEESIPFVSAQLNLTVANNTQPIPSANGLATSVSQYGVLSFSFSAYLNGGALVSSLFDLIDDPSESKIDKEYEFTITLLDGTSISKGFRLVSFAPSQALGTLPIYACGFTL